MTVVTKQPSMVQAAAKPIVRQFAPKSSNWTRRPAMASSSPQSGPRQSQKPEPKILFQKFFKSVGPRTYAFQVKEANNGNHFLVLTEGKRDDKTEQVRKTRLFIYSEDFIEFFKMIKATAEFIKANPVPDDITGKRRRFWKRQAEKGAKSSMGSKPNG